MKVSYWIMLLLSFCLFASLGQAQVDKSGSSVIAAAIVQNGSRTGDSLVADTGVLYTTGGSVNFTLNAGPGYAVRDYFLLGSISGTSPGTNLPGGKVLPLNWDLLTNLIITYFNSPFFVDFLGTLDAGGGATASFNTLGPLPPSTPPGLTMYFAFTTCFPYDFQSNPVAIDIVEPPEIIYVDDSNTTGVEDGTKAHPYNTIQEGVAAALQDEEVWVDDSGSIYAEEVDMKSGVAVKSINWDPTDGNNRASIDPPDINDTWSVLFNNVDNASIEGFTIGIPGINSGPWIGTEMVRVNGGTNNTIIDCYFTGKTDCSYVSAITAENSNNLTIAHCRMSGIDKKIDPNGCTTFVLIHADNCPGIAIRNNVFTDIRSSSDSKSKNFSVADITNTADVSVKNNLWHHFELHAQGVGAVLGKGYFFDNCTDIEISNNTSDYIDVTDAYFIQQVMCYYIDGCTNVHFTNNIITRVYCDGFPPPLGRGVQAINCTVVCDYTDIWTVEGPYYGGASPGVGAISADPLYIDPSMEDYDLQPASPAQNGDPNILDWDDNGSGGSRMGCHGGPGGETVGLLTPW